MATVYLSHDVRHKRGVALKVLKPGAVLYEMLTGDPPYVGSTAQAVLGEIIQGAPVRATEVRASIPPPNVEAAVRKALEKIPADGGPRPALSPSRPG